LFNYKCYRFAPADSVILLTALDFGCCYDELRILVFNMFL